ncbi:uncharacterized protein LOC142234964 [Haematobia irritans]|uniref:uncharacterized protein LOC142234964 n=1 Tax=Haematobia irritans TaxID=7368 RepID=UPI003F508CA7
MPTIRRCCIVGCMSNSRLNPNLQFFQFPRPDNPFYKLWTQACQASLSRILPFKKPVLCAEHFHPHCIGGRRLTSSAVPTLKLEVPTNLKAVEQQAMMEEIERSRKCAYINAVVYEWLVRANLNPQLRGSITHGMIKEKAETAKQIIGCETFTADNRWLNRFRESHLSGFAQKLASNQLKPMGPSLWIPDIVQDLQHLFPPTSPERMENFENVPEQYINYMKQYGEYEDDDETEQEQQPPTGYDQENGYADQKMSHPGGYYPQQHHPGQNYYQQPPHQAPPHHHQSPPPPQQPPTNGYNPYSQHPGGLHHPASSYNAYHDYYAHERHYQPQATAYPTQPPMHQQTPPRPVSHSPAKQQQEQARQASPNRQENGTSPQQEQMRQRASPVQQQQPPFQQQNPSPQQHQPSRPASQSSRTSPIDPLQVERTSSPAIKRPLTQENEDSLPKSKRSSPILNGSPHPEPIRINDNFKIKLPLLNGNNNGTSTPNPPSASPSNATNSNSRSSTPKSITDKGTTATDRNNASSPSPSSSLADTNGNIKDLETYDQALEYLKPLEDFALFKENFRAIGLISQLENILRKSIKPASKQVVTN